MMRAVIRVPSPPDPANSDQRIAPLAVSILVPLMVSSPHYMYLLGRLVNPAGDLSHEGGAVFGLRQAAHQNHQDERARRINNRCVVVDLGEFSRLMSHSRS